MTALGIRSAFCTAYLLLFMSSVNTHGGYWQTTVVAEAREHVHGARVSSGRVAWSEGLREDSQIFVYDDGVISQVTHSENGNKLIDIAGDHIAWSHTVPQDTSKDTIDLVVDGTTVAEGLPYWSGGGLDDSGLVWPEPLNSDRPSQINFFDGSAIHSLAIRGTRLNFNPSISGNRIVWSGFEGDDIHVYMYDGEEVTQLPESVGVGQIPQIDGDYVAGILVDDMDYTMGVTRYNVVSGHLETFPTEIRFTGVPWIAGEQMAWAAHIDGERQLFALDSHASPRQLTSGAAYSTGPLVTDSFVAWTGPVPERGIYIFDGESIAKIPQADATSVLNDADDNSVVWLRTNGSYSDIVLATFVVPEPNTLGLLGIAFSSLLFKVRSSSTHRT